MSTTQHIQSQLARLGIRLHTVSVLTDPNQKKKRHEERINIFQLAAQNVEQERLGTYMRRALIEKKKEMREQELAEKELQEQRLKQARLAQEQEAEKIRLAEEAKKREIDRLMQQRQYIEKQEAQKLAAKLAQELTEKNVKIKPQVIIIF